MRLRFALLLAVFAFCSLAVAEDGAQQFADLGTCKLENGQSITDCRIGYRTYGSLNAEKSNAVVVTTWFLGNSDSAAQAYVGGKTLVDPAKYFVVVIDALGDGVSSSPSNSQEQRRTKFPVFTIRDMVAIQHRLLEETLHLTHIHAVLGGSMGGMQALQWAYSYPDFMDRIVAIVPSPRLSSYDLVLWRSEKSAIENDVEFRGGDYLGRPMMQTVHDIHTLHLATPEYVIANHPPSDYPKFIEQSERGYFDPVDEIRQLQAMMSQDVMPGASIEAMAEHLKPKTLFVISDRDLMVNPTTALTLARASRSKLVELNNDCGHLAPGCEPAKVNPQVQAFLAGK